MVIGTDCICSCKSKYYKITTTTAPQYLIGTLRHMRTYYIYKYKEKILLRFTASDLPFSYFLKVVWTCNNTLFSKEVGQIRISLYHKHNCIIVYYSKKNSTMINAIHKPKKYTFIHSLYNTNNLLNIYGTFEYIIYSISNYRTCRIQK